MLPQPLCSNLNLLEPTIYAQPNLIWCWIFQLETFDWMKSLNIIFPCIIWRRVIIFTNHNHTHKLLRVSTRSMTSNALIRSISKSKTGTDDGRLVEYISLLVSLVGEWLLLLLRRWYLLKRLLTVSNSWLLLIPGVIFLFVTSQSICWSSTDRAGDEQVAFVGDNCSAFWLGDRIGDLIGDRVPQFVEDLEWLMRWWSHTTRSRM